MTDLNLLSVVEQIIAEGVQLGEVDPQVGHLEQILHLCRVHVVVLMLQVRGQHSHDDLETNNSLLISPI